MVRQSDGKVALQGVDLHRALLTVALLTVALLTAADLRRALHQDHPA